MHREAEATKAKAAADVRHWGGEEWVRKHPCIEEGEAGPSIECCKCCIAKGKVIFLAALSPLMVCIGLRCVRKPNAQCDECHIKKTRCDYPRPSVNVAAPSMSRSGVNVPQPWHKSLEVQCQGIAAQVRVNELEEAQLEVDRSMVHTIHKLTATLDRTRVVGSAEVAPSGQAGEDSPGVDWPGAGVRVSKGKGKEQAVEEEGDGEDPDVDYLE